MPPTTAQERSRQAASRYLSSIVVIDDKMSMGDSDDTHGLNVDALSRAFAQVDFSCGVYKPTGQQDEADVIAKLVRKSDAAVLDWNLINGQQAGAPGAQQATGQGTTLCTSVIQKVLEGDESTGNPIRLLVIYTAEGITETLVQDLHTALGRDELKVLPTKEFGLTSQNVKIVFKAKPGAGGAAIPFDRTTLSLRDLPGYIIEQYAELASGLMPPAVLHGLAALREKTGDLLGVFNKSLDPAMVLHAVLIPSSAKASNFLCELLSEECSTIIKNCEGVHDCLSIAAITEWLSQKTKFCTTHTPSIEYSTEQLLKCVNGKSQISDDESANLLHALYGVEGWWNEAKYFCRLCTLKHDPWSDTRKLDDKFVPRLTLGTIVKHDRDFLLCIIPPCDSARVKNGQPFPFIKLDKCDDIQTDKFSFSVEDSIDDKELANPKNISWRSLTIRYFSPAVKNSCVYGAWDDEHYLCHFTDASGKQLEWIGDLKTHIALKLATDLAPGLSRVGIDEFDWLRRKAKGE